MVHVAKHPQSGITSLQRAGPDLGCKVILRSCHFWDTALKMVGTSCSRVFELTYASTSSISTYNRPITGKVSQEVCVVTPDCVFAELVSKTVCLRSDIC